MEKILCELQVIVSQKYKINLYIVVFEFFGIILFIPQLLVFFGIGKDFFPSLGLKGIICTIIICLLFIFIDFFLYELKKINELRKKIVEINNINSNFINSNDNIDFELITDAKTLVEKNTQIACNAKVGIYTTGSRSRDSVYLNAIENRIANDEKIIYYRVLHGNPHNQILKDHLERIIDLRDPEKRPHGIKTICLGIYEKHTIEPEKFVCASESQALVVLPSFNSVGNYDTAIVFNNKEIVSNICRYVQNLYICSRRIENKKAIKELKLIATKEKNDKTK